MPRRTPEGILDERLRGIASAAERNTLAAFQGVAPHDIIAVWPELSPKVRTAILDAQGASLAAVGDYLGDLVDGFVPVDAAPWLGKIGEKPLDDWLDVTPRAHAARLAGGMTDSEAAVATAGYLSGTAGSEPFRIGREAVAVTSATDHRFTGWARIAEPGACAFCRMLATRGAVYTEQTVLRTFGGLKYHSNCRCSAKAMPKGAGATEWDGTGAPTGRPVGRPKGSKTIRRATVPDEVASAPPAPATPPPEPTPPPVSAPEPQPAPAAARFDAESVQRLTNADLDRELSDAWNAGDDTLAATLEDEMERRNSWAQQWGRTYDDYDDWRPLDSTGLDADDLPDFDDIPQRPLLTTRQIREEWEAELEVRYFDAEQYGAGIRPDLAAEAADKGIALSTLMTGDPRVAYKYANQELLQWWSMNGGRRPLYEHLAAHGRLSGEALARKKLTEDKARSLAQELIGKDRTEAMAARDAAQHRAKRAAGRTRTASDDLAAAQRRYQRAQKMAAGVT